MTLLLLAMDSKLEAPLMYKHTRFVPAEEMEDDDATTVTSVSELPLNRKLVPAELLPTSVALRTEMVTRVAGEPPIYTFPSPPAVVSFAAEENVT